MLLLAAVVARKAVDSATLPADAVLLLRMLRLILDSVAAPMMKMVGHRHETDLVVMRCGRHVVEAPLLTVVVGAHHLRMLRLMLLLHLLHVVRMHGRLYVDHAGTGHTAQTLTD